MSISTRRDLLAVLSAVAAGAGVPTFFVGPASAQNGSGAERGTLGPAHAIGFDTVPVTSTVNGGDRRVMLRGTLATGEKVELHQSTQMPGTPAPALHVVHHSELILVREGTLKLMHEVDGKIIEEIAGPGGAFYIAYGTNHAATNIGTTPARYFVVQIGGDVKGA